jgi:hypothetical protein
LGGAASLGKRKKKTGENENHTEWMVLDAMPPSKTEPRCGDTQSKIAAQLVHDGIGLKYRSCSTYVGQWYKEISTKEEKSGLINGGGKTWQLSQKDRRRLLRYV